MKKNLKLFLLVGLVASVGFTSCSEDEDTTVTPTPTTYGSINAYSAKLLGGQNNVSVGSFFATDSGVVVGSTAASASVALQGRIDLVFFYGTSNQASIGAPNDSVVAIAHTGSTSLPNWTTKNATKFYATTLTPAAFIASNNDSLVKTIDAALFTTSMTNMLTVDKVVAFKTAAGKFGLYHVASIDGTTGTDRSITINVKVQK